MTKINSNKVKNRVILPVVIIAVVVITAVMKANQVISFVTDIQSKNITQNERSKYH